MEHNRDRFIKSSVYSNYESNKLSSRITIGRVLESCFTLIRIVNQIQPLKLLAIELFSCCVML